ncbi:MAG TPA: EamA family transporter [Ktedonobacteraceae bacterium]|nr:EamA family transporter [Ktedonobacteraceae bacterium]
MRTVLLGLAVALCWGSADTVATLVMRHIGVAATTLIAQVAGLALAVGVMLCIGVPVLSPHLLTRSVLFGLVLGAIAAGAYLTLYQALAHGPLAIASPVVSAQGGVTLLLAVVVLHETIGTLPLVLLAITFAGILLAAINGGDVRTLAPRSLLTPGVAYALVSLLCFGLLAFGLGVAARETNWLLSVIVTRCCSCLLLAVFLRLWGHAPGAASETEQGHRQHPWWWVAAAGVGCADVGGLLLFALASATGSLGIAGMVASAYGVMPLAVGVAILKERLASTQVVGVAWLLVGLVGLAAPPSALAILAPGSAGLIVVAWAVLMAVRRVRYRRRTPAHVAKESR